MNQVAGILLVAFVLCVAILFLLEVGRRQGMHWRARHPDSGDGTGAVQGAVFSLMALLIGFTFSGAATRFEHRRELVVEESNAIGTAYLRLDLLPAETQPSLRDAFRRYVDARLAFYGALSTDRPAAALRSTSIELQGEIWKQAVAAAENVKSPAVMSLLLSAINEMIDITSTRQYALETHPSSLVFILLAGLVLAGSVLAGQEMSRIRTRSWFHMIGFAVIMTATIYIIFDLEDPRTGFVRFDVGDQIMVDLRQTLN